MLVSFHGAGPSRPLADRWVVVDLDRSNLGNARLQGLPQETLNGDPTGVLYDWVNSAFYFSYVSRSRQRVSSALSGLIRVLICVSHSAPSDPLSSPCNGLFQTRPTVILDGSHRHRMGDLFHFIGAYRALPPPPNPLMDGGWIHRRLHSTLQDSCAAGLVSGCLKPDSAPPSRSTFVRVKGLFLALCSPPA